MTIEVEYVQRLIRRRDLLPTSSAIEAGPYPIRIYTLGRFAILSDNLPLQFSGKAQKKPLALLKMLIALGGQGVAASALCDVLWPDSAGDNGRHALDMAVSRLRKLLGSAAAIIVHDAKFTINEKLVWLDAKAFEQSVEKYENQNQNRNEIELTLRLGAEAIRRYAGTFLTGEEDMPWLLGFRERLRARYLRVVLSYGALLEKNGEYEQAINCYQHALESEPVAEQIYQRLMHCHLMRGEYAQTVEIFRRCRKMLSIVLGVSPSTKTESFAARARGGESIKELCSP